MKKKSANISNPQVGHPMSSAKQPSNLRKSAESVDKFSEDDPQITQIRADLSTGGQI